MPTILSLASASRFAGNDYIGIRSTDSSVVRGVGVLPLFLGFIGLGLLALSLLATWLGESTPGQAEHVSPARNLLRFTTAGHVPRPSSRTAKGRSGT